MVRVSEAGQALLAGLQQGNRFLLGCHERADGDALGAMLGLALALQEHGKQTFCYSPDGVPSLHRFLPGWEQVANSLEPAALSDLDWVVLLDCEGLDRCRGLAETLPPGARLAIVDHHVSAGGTGYLDIRDQSASAAALLIAELLECLGWPLSEQVATCLLAGIYFDTGSLRYENTDPRTLEACSRLAQAGAKPSWVANQLYEQRPWAALRLLGIALGRTRQADGGRLLVASLDDQAFLESSALREDLEGIVDLMRTTRDAQLIALCAVMGDGTVKVSLRSKGQADVAAVARRWGGGGHPRAAGFSLSMPIDQAEDLVLSELSRILTAGDP